MKRVLGVDLGEARIGLAISDELGMLAHPLQTVAVKEGDPLPKIEEVVAQNNVGTIVLGMPRNMNGTYGPAAEKAKAFAQKLQERLPQCQHRLWDERMSTAAAQKSLHAAGRNTKQSRSVIDQVAAQIILQGYLDSQAMF